LGNGEFKWMKEDWRGFWKILTYSGNFSTPIPFIPLIPKQALKGITTTIPKKKEREGTVSTIVS
jgi:hypothetical protein